MDFLERQFCLDFSNTFLHPISRDELRRIPPTKDFPYNKDRFDGDNFEYFAKRYGPFLKLNLNDSKQLYFAKASPYANQWRYLE